MTDAPPLSIVAFVSGKGGVGKTMLAVAFARELSQKSPTLLVDLDLFNRGLTGLMRHGKLRCEVSIPDFLGTVEAGKDSWEVIEVAPNLYHLRFPDLTEEQLRHIENYDPAALAAALKDYITLLASRVGAINVVLDCHGGPDKLSFAACLVAQRSLLVSEPDKITFYGTLHFVRQLQASVADSSTVDLHLIFNKVVPAFSVRYLTRFYNREIRPLFNFNPLLAVFPLEVYLTKEFEKTPFVTDAFPFSLLARKMEVLLYDLFKKERDRIPRSVLSLAAIARSHRRRTLGKQIWLLDLNVVTATITAGFVLYFLQQQFLPATHSDQQHFKQVVDEVGRQIFTLNLLDVLQKFPASSSQACAENDPMERFSCIQNLASASRALRDEMHEVNVNYMPDYIGRIRAIESRLDPRLLTAIALLPRWYKADDYNISTQLKDRRDQIQELRGRNDLRENTDPAIRGLYQQIVARQLPPYRPNQTPEVFFAFLGVLAVYWLFGAIVLAWSQSLDRKFTYFVRLRRYVSSCLPYAAALVIWCAIVFLFVGLSHEAFRAGTVQEVPLPNSVYRALVLLSMLPAWFAIANQLLKVWREARFGKHGGEATARFVFVLFVLAVPNTIYLISYSRTSPPQASAPRSSCAARSCSPAHTS
jgi:cellulose biosynthesis protein BcsQ